MPPVKISETVLEKEGSILESWDVTFDFLYRIFSIFGWMAV